MFACFCVCARWYRGMFVALQPEGCRFESTSSRPRRDLEQVLRAQLLCNIIASAPSRRVALLNFVRRAISKISCIVLYCISKYYVFLYKYVLDVVTRLPTGYLYLYK